MKSIAFVAPMREVVGAILLAAGFVEAEIIEQPVEMLSYERRRAAGIAVVEFHGTTNRDNRIYGSAAVKGIAALKSLKELLPNYLELPIYKAQEWRYRDEQELDLVLGEIAALVTGHLLLWFETPVENPSGADMRPLDSLSNQEMREHVLRNIRIHEAALERAKQAADSWEVVECEFLLDLFRRQLTELPD
ncbi:MAG: hypothetical protein KJ065_12895 [Anaerolineae bacterium]|nr:hypothetical protein [Anaerolineae bacterium]